MNRFTGDLNVADISLPQDITQFLWCAADMAAIFLEPMPNSMKELLDEFASELLDINQSTCTSIVLLYWVFPPEKRRTLLSWLRSLARD